jgi:hypothetical protein
MANRFAVGADGTAWNSTANWSTSTGGAPGASVPGTSDVAIFDGNSNNCVLPANATVQDINISAYPNGKQISIGAYNLTCNRHFTGNASATAPITGTTGIFTLGASTTAATWAMSNTIFDCLFTAAGTGAKTMSGSYTLNKNHVWSKVCNLTNAGGGKITCRDGWTGTSYFNDAETNPTVDILGGLISGTLPNTMTGCLLKPSVSDITFEEGYPYKTTLREATYLIAETSTYDIIHENAQTYFVTFNGKLKCSAIYWESFYWASGNFTQEEDVNAFALDVNWMNNGIVTSNDFKFNVTNWNMRGTNLITGLNVRFVGTTAGDFARPMTTGGSDSAGTVTLNCNIEIDTTSTVTRANRDITFTGGSFTYTSGTYVPGTGLSTINGAFSLDIDDAFDWYNFDVNAALTLATHCRVTTLDVFDGGSVSAPYAFTCNRLKLKDASQVARPNDALKIEVDTFFYMFGTDEKTPSIVASPINLTPFKGGLDTTMNNAGQTPFLTSYKRKTHTTTGALSDYSVAFDFIYTPNNNYTLIQGSGYLWIPSEYEPYFYFNLSGSNGYRFYHGLSNDGTNHRIVIVKQYGQTPKMYIDGVLKYPAQMGTSQINSTLALTTFASLIRGDYLIFDSVVSTDWIAADYAAFVANGISSADVYDDTEAGLFAGWHVDSYTADNTQTHLEFKGTDANCKLSNAQFRYVDACESVIILSDWHGDVVESCGIRTVTGNDIGGAGVSVTHF